MMILAWCDRLGSASSIKNGDRTAILGHSDHQTAWQTKKCVCVITNVINVLTVSPLDYPLRASFKGDVVSSSATFLSPHFEKRDPSCRLQAQCELGKDINVGSQYLKSCIQFNNICQLYLL